MAFEQWQLDRIYKWNSCLAQLHLPGRGCTNVSPLFNNWDVCRTTTSFSYEQLGTSFYLRESLCRREEVLSAPRISSFWKRSVSLSLLGVFLLVVFGLCLCFGVVLFRHSEDIWLFAFHLFSYNLRIVDRPHKTFWWPSEPRARTAWVKKKQWTKHKQQNQTSLKNKSKQNTIIRRWEVKSETPRSDPLHSTVVLKEKELPIFFLPTSKASNQRPSMLVKGSSKSVEI